MMLSGTQESFGSLNRGLDANGGYSCIC